MPLIDKERGEIVCRKCGLIINDKEFENYQDNIKTFNEKDKIKRWKPEVPISFLLPEIGLNTLIKNKKIYNTDLKRAVKRDSNLSWKQQNITIAIRELKRLNSELNYPDYVNEFAFELYKNSFKMNLIKGRSIKGMVAACIYFACRINGIPITFNEIIEETNESKKLVKLCYKSLIKNFPVKIPNSNPLLFIPKYISKLNLDFEIEKLSIKILTIYLNNNFFHGKKPKGICAGAIYLASKLKNLKISQKEICELMNITEVTLRARYKEIMTNIDMIFN